MAMDRRPLADRRRERTDVVEERSSRSGRLKGDSGRGPIGLVRNGVAFELDVDPAPGLIGHLVRTRLLKIMIA